MGGERDKPDSKVIEVLMSTDLLQLVTSELLPRLSGMGLVVRAQEQGADFDNALVVLESGELRVQVLRERSQLFLDIGSKAQPTCWFDSAVVIDYLGLGDDTGFHGQDPKKFVSGAASFLKTFEPELRQTFSRTEFDTTKAELSALRDARAGRRLGFS